MKINPIFFKPIAYKQQNNHNIIFTPKNNLDSFEKNHQISFGETKMSPANFKIKDIDYLHCPICGQLMLNEKQQKAFIEKVANKKGMELFQALEEYNSEYTLDEPFTKNQHLKDISVYRGQKKEVVRILQNQALAHPKLSLSELVEQQAQISLQNLINVQMKIVHELENYISDTNFKKEEEQKIRVVIAKYTEQIKGESPIRFKRKNFIKELSHITTEHQKQKRIDKIINKLPTSNSSVDSFFVKYSDKKRSNEEIASKLILGSLPTCEHLVPKAKGGKDTLENYLCDCADCNSSRGDTDFYIWHKQKPQMQKNLQDHIKELKIKTSEKSLPKAYNDYIKNTTKIIYALSRGEIVLTMPKK